MAESVLIVDDDPVSAACSRRWSAGSAMSRDHRRRRRGRVAVLTGADGPPFECVVLDLVMPDLDGLGVLAQMREAGIAMPVIVQTAHGGIDNVVSAMRAGATDFVVKPVGAERLQVSMRNAMARGRCEGEFARIKRSRGRHLDLRGHRHPQPADAGGAARGARRRRIRRSRC